MVKAGGKRILCLSAECGSDHEMKSHQLTSRSIFKEIGEVRWRFDAFAVRTKRGAIMMLSPNSDVSPSVVRIDEIRVPERIRGRGAASEALATLCRLADQHGFTIEGGPVGWSNSASSKKFVEWLRRFGFRKDPEPPIASRDDPFVFNVRRRPKPPRRLSRRKPIHPSRNEN
jgi:predicted GNAT family acetyltransferase